ncbi:uncharacterized protein N7506_012269 [Penicillium brevicompactum]|uniref:uncharacterized protein n=1 Tax=Penicillium brevicompactum TaxID=5074 RepID=UPI0025418EEC|nr:uncharacterized protein N7506_012269 [Penicillium brevicompactum]KAJ5319565.1 hypothetical protein N7506_012269 [Penicillium brevicompactum]
MSREQIFPSTQPRESALQYVTNNGQYTLRVNEFLPAARPSGQEAYSSFVTNHRAPDVRIHIFAREILTRILMTRD